MAAITHTEPHSGTITNMEEHLTPEQFHGLQLSY